MFETRFEFIKRTYPMLQNLLKGSGINPVTALAFAIVESQSLAKDGNYYPATSVTSLQANNLFGIKDSKAWTGQTIDLNTPNDADKVSTFRKYPTQEASILDFVNFLQVNPRYKKVFDFPESDYKKQIDEISKAGYAENPNSGSLKKMVADSVNKTITELKYISPSGNEALNNALNTLKKNRIPLAIFAASLFFL